MSAGHWVPVVVGHPPAPAYLIAALRRLSAAALARDATMGDPITLLNARAELHNANLQAMDAIGQAIGRTT